MSALSLRIYQRKARILAIEPNRFHEADLRWTRRVVGRMDYGVWAAGDVAGEAELYIPVYRGVAITAEASLSRQFVVESPSLRVQLGARMDSCDFEIVRQRVEVRRLDDLGLRPALVKVDVQGHELSALTGMAATLSNFGPPVLVEAPSPDTTQFMAALGYAPYAYDRRRNVLGPVRGGETNVLFARSLPNHAR
jgi:FkbM family methyltransferase